MNWILDLGGVFFWDLNRESKAIFFMTCTLELSLSLGMSFFMNLVFLLHILYHSKHHLLIILILIIHAFFILPHTISAQHTFNPAPTPNVILHTHSNTQVEAPALRRSERVRKTLTYLQEFHCNTT